MEKADISGATISFYDAAAPLTSVTFTQVYAEDSSGANVTPATVPSWDASFSVFNTELPPGGFAGTNSVGMVLNNTAFEVSLPQAILSQMDTAFAANQAVPASFHADVFLEMTDAATLGTKDTFVIDFHLTLDVNGTVTKGI
jgi:hypothetical protein